MVSGTVHFWHWLELLFTLDRVGYQGWLGGDIAPRQMSPVAAYDLNTRMLERMTELVRRMGPDTIAALMREGDIAETFGYLSSCLVRFCSVLYYMSTRKAYPTDLTDEQWKVLEPLVPAVKTGGRRAQYERREIVNAIS